MKREPWEPATDQEWLAFFKLQAEINAEKKAETTMTDEEIAIALKIYNMLKFLLDVGDLASQSSGEVTGAKNDLLDGPITVTTVSAPVPADYPTAPVASPKGAKAWGRGLRKRVMPFCSDGTASSLHYIKGEAHFVQADYLAPIDGSTTIGNIHVETSTKNCNMHNLYARLTGTEFWIFVRTFEGASYDYHRIPTVANKAESVELMLMGVFHNVEDGHPSATFTILYMPQQTPPPTPVV